MKLRLLLFEECNRTCKGCCNKQWDLNYLPLFRYFDLKQFDEIILTGGEPFLHPEIIIDVSMKIRKLSPESEIYIYTAMVKNHNDVLNVLNIVDGITLTLHEQDDVNDFNAFEETLFFYFSVFAKKSLRLNVFKGVELKRDYILMPWVIKDNIEWIENCHLPEGEIFMKMN